MEIHQEHGEPLVGAALPEAHHPVVQAPLFFYHLPDAAIRDVWILVVEPEQLAIVKAFDETVRQRAHIVGVALDEHALYREQVAGHEDEDALVASVRQGADAARPAIHHPVDEGCSQFAWIRGSSARCRRAEPLKACASFWSPASRDSVSSGRWSA